MMKKQEIHDSFYQVMDAELAALRFASSMMYTDLPAIVEKIINAKGKVLFIGVGKSGLILKKTTSTFNSLRIPAYFLHAGEMLHGDLGAISKNDVIIIASKSGNSQEIVAVLDALEGRDVIGITEQKDSELGRRCKYQILIPPSKEADEFNIVPTSSTTVQLAICDALALTVVRNMETSKEDFASAHPGGALGKRLNLKVGHIMKAMDYYVSQESPLPEVVVAISAGRMGACAVIENKKVVGIITDGDIRRMIEKGWNPEVQAKEIMSDNPKTISSSAKVLEAMHIMEDNKITQLIVQDEDQFKGFVHLHDCLSSGV